MVDISNMPKKYQVIHSNYRRVYEKEGNRKKEYLRAEWWWRPDQIRSCKIF